MGALSIHRNLFGLAAASALLAALPATPAHAACTKATNIEAIIDDSGSMDATDPDLLRVKGMKLLIGQLASDTTLGAVEFGGNFFAGDPTPPADTLFPPEAIGPNAAAMGTAMDNLVHADNGGTDYNAAFTQSDTDNPGADARIFLTDGGHDIGTYNNGHLVHKVPTYVIGFSQGIQDEDKARLNQIATDTGGVYYPETDSSLLQSVMNSIGSALTCQAAPKAFTDQLAAGKSVGHSILIAGNTRSAKIVLTWASPLDAFTISSFRIVRHGKTVAKAAKVRKLKVKRTTTDTYVVVQLSRLVKGTLRFKVKATKVGSGAPKATLTTQVSRQK
jgi:von Willebrand factor type A domain